MDIMFSGEELSEIETVKSHYPDQKAALMHVLWMAQKKFGWISTEVKQYVAELLGLSFAHVHGVASFYTMYYKKPMGKYHVQVCTNISCMLKNGDKIYDHISGRLGIKHNETTADGLFSIEEVECMGACGGAPMIAINEDYYENLDTGKVDQLLNSLK